MTRNQIDYFNAKENARHNRNVEYENARHNRAAEEISSSTVNETVRHDIASEGISMSELGETTRHNRRQEDISLITANSLSTLQYAQAEESAIRAGYIPYNAYTQRLGAESQMMTATATADKLRSEIGVARTNAETQRYAAETTSTKYQSDITKAEVDANLRQQEILNKQRELDLKEYSAKVDAVDKETNWWLKGIDSIVRAASGIITKGGNSHG